MPTTYGDDPAPPRYFFRDREKPKEAVVEPKQEAVAEPKQEAVVEPKKKTSVMKDLDWRQFVVILMRALVPFPEARDAVKAAFWAAGAETSP